MGNESGYGENIEEALRWTRVYDPTRLTHYESYVFCPEDYTPEDGLMDVYSRMYPPIEQIDAYFDREHADAETLALALRRAKATAASLMYCANIAMPWAMVRGTWRIMNAASTGIRKSSAPSSGSGATMRCTRPHGRR